MHALARRAPLVALDLEFTGLDPSGDRICEIALIRDDGERVVTFETLVCPGVPVTKGAQAVHGLSDDDLADAPVFAEVAGSLRALLEGAVVVCHNVELDLCFLHAAFEAVGDPLPPPITLDTLLLCRRLFAFPRNDLGSACERLNIEHEHAHRALGDAKATFLLIRRILEVMDPSADVTVSELANLVEALAPNSALRVQQQQVLREAFREKRTVWIDYVSTSDPGAGIVQREVGIWHLRLPRLQGWCYLRNGERVFRVDRIRSVRDGEHDYDIPSFKKRI